MIQNHEFLIQIIHQNANGKCIALWDTVPCISYRNQFFCSEGYHSVINYTDLGSTKLQLKWTLVETMATYSLVIQMLNQ